MDDSVRKALEQDRTIDITTIGRKSGIPRRIEIWFHRLGGRLYIAGTPGPRDWYANLTANPEFTFHLKGSARADLPAKATPILDDADRRRILLPIVGKAGQEASELEEWVRHSPLVEVELDHYPTQP